MKHFDIASAAFAGAVDSLGGTLGKPYRDTIAIYDQATLPVEKVVLPDDALKPGVGMHVTRNAVTVAPYVFRIVCKNGALLIRRGAELTMEIRESVSEDRITEFVRTSTVSVTRPQAIRAFFDEIDLGIRTWMTRGELLREIFSGGARASEALHQHLMTAAVKAPPIRNRYEAMNVITAAARAIEDPVLRWQMESFATTILTEPRRKPNAPRDSCASMSSGAPAESGGALTHEHSLSAR